MDALGIGVAVRDVVVWLDTFPSPDQKVRAKDMFESGGGPVPTALVTLARLGDQVAFAGVVGDNAVGRFIVESLQRENVDVSRVLYKKGFASPTSVILVENGRRTVFECFQYGLPLCLDELEAGKLAVDPCRFFLADARLVEIQIEVARRLRGNGAKVVLDCGHPRQGVDELLGLTDIAIFSHSYPKALYGEGYNPKEFLLELSHRLPEDGARIAGLTMGEEGCAIYTPDGSYTRIAGHSVKAVDSTGAGDVFHGAFVHAYLDGASPAEAARFANAAAALKCERMTGRSPLPPEDAIQRFAQMT